MHGATPRDAQLLLRGNRFYIADVKIGPRRLVFSRSIRTYGGVLVSNPSDCETDYSTSWPTRGARAVLDRRLRWSRSGRDALKKPTPMLLHWLEDILGSNIWFDAEQVSPEQQAFSLAGIEGSRMGPSAPHGQVL